jgi:hypothetical protein
MEAAGDTLRSRGVVVSLVGTMSSVRNIIGSFYVTAIGLVVLSLIFEPMGFGRLPARWVASQDCGGGCPCAKGERRHQLDQPEEQREADLSVKVREAGSGHDDDDRDHHECPDDCPNCSFCPGAAVAILPSTATTGYGYDGSASLLVPEQALPRGFPVGVFRPPRSLS